MSPFKPTRRCRYRSTFLRCSSLTHRVGSRGCCGRLGAFTFALMLASCGEDSDNTDASTDSLALDDAGGSAGSGGGGGNGGDVVEEEMGLFPLTGVGALAEPVVCDATPNPGDVADGDLNVDLQREFQTITGFGGISAVSFFGVDAVTAEEVDVAFGTGPGQVGLTVLRLPLSSDPDQFGDELPTARRAAELGALIFASPWTPPAELKSNGSTIGGELLPENYGAYADHLMSYQQFMADNDVPIRAISIQNEPDIDMFRPEGPISYDGCQWSPDQIASFLKEQGPRFGSTQLIAPESFNFNRDWSDPLLNDPEVAAEFEIVAGHIYGGGLSDYPLARNAGKQVWMTEHYSDSGSEPDRANFWPLAYGVPRELHRSMEANFNAYVWWFIRRGYGFLFDSGEVTKRGYFMSQYARFVRPGFVRVAVSASSVQGVEATAYKNGPGSVVVVVLNDSEQEQTVALDIFGSCVSSFERITTSETKNAESGTPVTLVDGRVSVTLDALSVTTFVSPSPQ